MGEQQQVQSLEFQIIGPDALLVLSAIEKMSADNKDLRALVVRLAGALEDIADPLGAIKRLAAEQGAMVEGMAAVELCNSGSHLRGLARQALAAVPPELRGETGEKL